MDLYIHFPIRLHGIVLNQLSIGIILPSVLLNVFHIIHPTVFIQYNVFDTGLDPRHGDLLADSHNILNKWKNCFSQLLNVHTVSDIRQFEIDTAELLVPDPSPFEVEILWQISKGITRQVVIVFWENLFKQEVKHYSP
jgi:hypothetical protein